MDFDDAPMPPDPFADDPNDPASFMDPDPDGDYEELSAEEVFALQEDLENVRLFRSLLEPRGILGIATLCDDCDEVHYYDWAIIVGRITTMLSREPAPVHEPGAAPDPKMYVTWDYCAGYADAADHYSQPSRAPRTRYPWSR
ncbi:DUF5319 domain-containing protein [Corynebacterium bovis]|uniref:DUF5319 domain-containing protein n=1 Tax=Corynebacterium bovis TaxID=36808 RepID=UPI00254A699C|nr:DUF5319 domain-containing protein [Corynebacterium bovis]MDK8511253.1 DUF5319 domain-containing protein [Corynebacterium bovis]